MLLQSGSSYTPTHIHTHNRLTKTDELFVLYISLQFQDNIYCMSYAFCHMLYVFHVYFLFNDVYWLCWLLFANQLPLGDDKDYPILSQNCGSEAGQTFVVRVWPVFLPAICLRRQDTRGPVNLIITSVSHLIGRAGTRSGRRRWRWTRVPPWPGPSVGLSRRRFWYPCSPSMWLRRCRGWSGTVHPKRQNHGLLR